MKSLKDDLLLYVVSDRSWLGSTPLEYAIEKAILGGATFIQLREKNLDFDSFLNQAKTIKSLCDKYDIPFVINDNIDIAILSNADGVHLGQGDMNTFKARHLIGNDKIIGVSVQTVPQAIKAQNDGANYLGVGAIFDTNSKADAKNVSIDTLQKICNSVDIPVIAIGGICDKNIAELSNSGICGVAVISAVLAKPDIEKAASELKKLAQKTIDIQSF